MCGWRRGVGGGGCVGRRVKCVGGGGMWVENDISSKIHMVKAVRLDFCLIV